MTRTAVVSPVGAFPVPTQAAARVRAAVRSRRTGAVARAPGTRVPVAWTTRPSGTADTTTTSLVNPPDPDPARSPSVQPRDLTDEQSHTYRKPCLYELSLTARDDDSGTGTDAVPVIVQGNAPLSLLADVWYVKYLSGDLTGLGKDTLDCYLKVVQHASAVFSEARDVSTQEKAANTLFLSLLDPKRTLDRQLLAAWLNFANGAFEPDELVDTDGDLKPDTPFLEAVQKAEQVRLDPNATSKELAEQTAILTCVNIPLV